MTSTLRAAVPSCERTVYWWPSTGGMEYPMWTAHGQHMARMMSPNGTFESDIKSQRVREAAERRAQAGRMNGPCPYGWRREYERTASGRVIDSREVEDLAAAEVVREITYRLLAGESLLAVTRSLNDRGMPFARCRVHLPSQAAGH